jgi:hypothetical protein
MRAALAALSLAAAAAGQPPAAPPASPLTPSVAFRYPRRDNSTVVNALGRVMIDLNVTGWTFPGDGEVCLDVGELVRARPLRPRLLHLASGRSRLPHRSRKRDLTRHSSVVACRGARAPSAAETAVSRAWFKPCTSATSNTRPRATPVSHALSPVRRSRATPTRPTWRSCCRTPASSHSVCTSCATRRPARKAVSSRMPRACGCRATDAFYIELLICTAHAPLRLSLHSPSLPTVDARARIAASDWVTLTAVNRSECEGRFGLPPCAGNAAQPPLPPHCGALPRFRFFLYEVASVPSDQAAALYYALRDSRHRTSDPAQACVFIGTCPQQGAATDTEMATFAQQLWEDGRPLLIFIATPYPFSAAAAANPRSAHRPTCRQPRVGHRAGCVAPAHAGAAVGLRRRAPPVLPLRRLR